MKKIISVLAIYIMWNLILFLSISFYYTSFEISEWHKDARFTFSFIGIGLGVFISVWTYCINQLTK